MTDSALATIPNVPLVTVGNWLASTGPFRPTRSWCMDAVSAFNDDPGIIAPRVYPGHRPDELRAGEPALGIITAMRWSEDDLTVYGDVLTLRTLAEAAPVLFPNRSIEAWSNFTSPATGRTYEGVIDGLALLGVEWPAVPVLEDLTRLASGDLTVLTVTDADAVTDRIAASANDGTGARRIAASSCWKTTEGNPLSRIAAQIEMDTVWREFYAQHEADHPWWWIRADLADPLGLIVQGDDELLRIDVTVNGTDVSFGEPSVVTVQYVDKVSTGGDAVAASVGKPLRVAAAHANESATRRTTNTENDMDANALRDATGLGPDASDADVLAAVAEKFGTAGGTNPAGSNDGDDEDTHQDTGAATPHTTDNGGEPVVEPVDVPNDAVPVDASGNPLVATIDRHRLSTLEADAAAGREARTLLAAQHRDRVIAEHRNRGAIVGAADSESVKTWAAAMDRDPVGTENLLKTLASGKVPVDGERGLGRDTDQTVHSAEAHAARMAMHGKSSQGIPVDTTTKGH